jgi:hypothetical protein
VNAYADTLDDLAERVFGDEVGQARVAPLLTRFDREVSPLRSEDPHGELWQAIRTDWALVDAPIPGGRGPGDTWARRAMWGEMPGIEPDDAVRRVAASVADVFEVWGGDPVRLRAPRSGICAPLRDAVRLLPTGGGPEAIWEARVVIVDGAAELCRPPLPYPPEIASRLLEAGRRRFAAGEPLSLATLRRAWLHLHRAPRADARSVFGRLLG